MDEIQIAATLATISANQLNQTKVIEALSSDIRDAREAGAAATLEVTQALGLIVTDVATTRADVANHQRSDNDRFEMLWRTIKWGGGALAAGGTVAGGAKIASALAKL